MKLAIITLALVGSAFSMPYGGHVNTGHSAQYRHDDGHGGYEFGYNEDHATGGTFRKEKGGPGYQEGSYGLRDADGRLRIVHYIADHNGFRVKISTNEEGVDVKQDPASTSLNSVHHGPVEHHMPIETHALAPVHKNHYAEPMYAHEAPIHSVPIDAVHTGPLVHHQPEHYSEQLYTAHSHAEPLFDSQRLNYGPSKPSAAYSASHYGPALGEALMVNAYDAQPTLKSAYVPDDAYAYGSAEYSPTSNGHYDNSDYHGYY